MTPDEAVAVMAYLSSAYPRNEITEATVSAYAGELSDLDGQVVLSAARAHVRLSKWFPTIAEIREATGLSMGYPTPAMAWGQVVEGCQKESRKEMHPVVRRVFNALIGGFWSPDTSSHTRKLFIECYIAEVESDRTAHVREEVLEDNERSLVGRGNHGGPTEVGAGVGRHARLRAGRESVVGVSQTVEGSE